MSPPDAKQRPGEHAHVRADIAPAPWFAAPAPQPRGHAAIIGGGIAGASAAAALHRRGWVTTIVERHVGFAAEASGTPSGVVMPRLTAGDAVDGRIHAAAWLYGIQTWRDRGFYDPCGVLQLATDDEEARRQAAVAAQSALPAAQLLHLDPAAASAMAGCALSYGALYFPAGGCIDTAAFCKTMAAGTTAIFGRTVTAIDRVDERWRLDGDDGEICTADVVIFANAGGVGAFPQGAGLPLAARRGQITRATATAATRLLRCVLAYGGTISPAQAGVHPIGATFDWVEDGTSGDTLNAADDLRNLEALTRVLPDFGGLVSHGASWAAVRWTSPDHLPAVGPLPNRAAYERDYASLRHGRHWVATPPATYEPGLYVMAGFGSHGLVLSPLAAELLACQITGDPLPLDQDLVAALHPGRFLIRALKRQK